MTLLLHVAEPADQLQEVTTTPTRTVARLRRRCVIMLTAATTVAVTTSIMYLDSDDPGFVLGTIAAVVAGFAVVMRTTAALRNLQLHVVAQDQLRAVAQESANQIPDAVAAAVRATFNAFFAPDDATANRRGPRTYGARRADTLGDTQPIPKLQVIDGHRRGVAS